MSDGDFAAAAGTSGRAPGSGKHRGPRFTWNPQYEATFFRSLCESVSLGLRDGSTFKPEAWERAMQALIEKHNAYANKGHLINKTDNARKKYRLWRGLREDPEFYYDPTTRTVSATEDAWARHLEKEPLARSLRARPFEHEEYYEILFPDVIGSGGAPKRLTKPRRKTNTDAITAPEDAGASDNPIMDLLTDTGYINPSQTHMAPPALPPAMTTPMTTHAPQPPPQQPQHQPHQQHQQHQQHQPHQQHQQQPQPQHRVPSNAMPPPPQPRPSVSSTSALTPPEDTNLQSRKRMQPSDGTNAASAHQADKRRRTAAGYLDLTQQRQQQQQQQQQQLQQQQQQAQHPTSAGLSVSQANGATPVLASQASNATQPTTMPAAAAAAATAMTTPASLPETLHLLAEAIRSAARGGRPSPGWQEQAMDIFFRDFAVEDMDLQLKIAEKVLTDENKAMVFCKMPDALRRHWVKRLREVHNRNA